MAFLFHDLLEGEVVEEGLVHWGGVGQAQLAEEVNLLGVGVEQL